MNLAVVGCGAFGLAAALELRARGHNVTAFDQGPVPNPLGSSHDTSKTIQRLYANRHETYICLAEAAEPRWREWQRQVGGDPFYFPIGHVVVATDWRAGTRGRESVSRLGLTVYETADARARFPQLLIRPDDVVFFDAWGGYLASARAVAAMAALARAAGVEIRESSPVRALDEGASAVRLRLSSETLAFDRVIIASGVWIPRLVPAAPIAVTRQSMAFFEPDEPALHRPGLMPVWAFDGADEDAWYGHPLADGRVKAADNPRGPSADPDDHRDAPPDFAVQAAAFAARRLPGLSRGRLVGTRACLYENTPDGDFLIDWAPGSRRVLVAGGGSGHGFKFAASLGPVIADALEDRDNPDGALFRARGRFRA